jgi:hypothetical protein
MARLRHHGLRFAIACRRTRAIQVRRQGLLSINSASVARDDRMDSWVIRSSTRNECLNPAPNVTWRSITVHHPKRLPNTTACGLPSLNAANPTSGAKDRWRPCAGHEPSPSRVGTSFTIRSHTRRTGGMQEFYHSPYGRVDRRLRDQAQGKAATNPLETGHTAHGNGSDNDRHL